MPSPINALGSTPTATGSSPLSQATGGLGKDDFLKLLVGQLQNQNPLSPVGDQEFMSQMAAFSTLEQVTNMAASSERLEQTVAADQSLALIGHQVSYLKADGSSAEGKVERVSFGKEGFTLTIAGEAGIQPGVVSEVR
jgi:flagellar basal-body rod modification protein FlgD